jgi:uncharacterized membrane protein YfcA
MMYGTLLSPILIGAGYRPSTVVPCILFSQAVGGLTASVFHHRLKNAQLFRTSQDSKVVALTILLGISLAAVGGYLCAKLPAKAITLYVGAIALSMGLIVLAGIRFRFTWTKMGGVAALSSFNKGFSGGGFGPIMTSGQLVIGRHPKKAIGSTTLAEAPICLVGFAAISATSGFPPPPLFCALNVGAIIGALVGPHLTRFLPADWARRGVAVLAVFSGAWVLRKLL